MIIGGSGMMLFGGGGSYNGPKEIKYLFVDGGYFRKIVEDFSKHFYDGKDLMQFINFEQLKRGHHPQYTKVFYYDCPVPQKNGESSSEHAHRLAEQKDLFNSIRFLDGFHLFEGTTTGKPGKSRQKQVDVKIAVDMLSHTYNGNMHQCTLIAGDLDFKPVVDALVMAGMYTTLWYKEGSTSEELIYASDAKVAFDYHTIFRLLEEEIQQTIILPQFVINDSLKQLNENSLIEKAVNSLGEEIQIHHVNEIHYVVEPYLERNKSRYKIYNCKNMDMLLRYYEAVNGKVGWPKKIRENRYQKIPYSSAAC